MFAFGWSSCGRKPEYPEETHLSDLVTKRPSHMPTLGIEPGSQWWEANALTLRQPDSSLCLSFTTWLNNNEIKSKGDDDSDGDGDDYSDGDGNDDIDDDTTMTAVGGDCDDDMFYSFWYWLAIALVILYSL